MVPALDLLGTPFLPLKLPQMTKSGQNQFADTTEHWVFLILKNS